MGRYQPAGSYLETSTDVTVVLSCEAQQKNGNWIPAELQIQDLAGGLVNLDGQLMPEHDEEPAQGYVPSGSYQITCRNIKVVLNAKCRRRDQSINDSSLDITNYITFPGTLVNDNGNLAVNMS
jgi:hypothetical protein